MRLTVSWRTMTPVGELVPSAARRPTATHASSGSAGAGLAVSSPWRRSTPDRDGPDMRPASGAIGAVTPDTSARIQSWNVTLERNW